jgi:FkbM family methyltransferase
MRTIDGLLLSLRQIGIKYTVKEIIRRILKKPYTYNGIVVEDSATFRAIRNLSSRGVVWAEGGLAYFRGRLGTFAAPKARMLWVFSEDLEGMYGVLDVRGRAVADVGAYLGETAVLFAKWGAKYVYAYEPVFYKYAEYNLRLNGVANAEVRPYGLWTEEDVLSVAPTDAATGLGHGELKIQVKPLAKALQDVDAAKIDCEGCEWALVATPCEVIRRVEEYVVEIHGPTPPLLRRMEKCGYKLRPLSQSQLVSIWHFSL